MADASGFEAATNRIAWQPDESVKARAQLTRFLSFCGLESWEQLYRRSIEDIAWFHEHLLRFLDLRFDRPYAQIVDLSRGIEWPRWCVDGKLNITKSCLDRWLDSDDTAHRPAVI